MDKKEVEKKLKSLAKKMQKEQGDQPKVSLIF